MFLLMTWHLFVTGKCHECVTFVTAHQLVWHDDIASYPRRVNTKRCTIKIRPIYQLIPLKLTLKIDSRATEIWMWKRRTCNNRTPAYLESRGAGSNQLYTVWNRRLVSLQKPHVFEASLGRIYLFNEYHLHARYTKAEHERYIERGFSNRIEKLGSLHQIHRLYLM
jgi:hypothetical protein